jgi:hypothetical protein
MNSATLTDTDRKARFGRSETTRPDDGFHAWHFFVLVSILLATVAVVMTRRSTPENLILLSFTIAAAGLTAGALYRMLLPLTTTDLAVLDQPMTERYRATLERDKALTLRTIKELEFDRAMGKLSQKDYDEMVARLRQRALSLMKQLDEGRTYTTAIEAELSRRMGTQSSRVPAVCACGAAFDDDAVFCKKCGARVRA